MAAGIREGNPESKHSEGIRMHLQGFLQPGLRIQAASLSPLSVLMASHWDQRDSGEGNYAPPLVGEERGSNAEEQVLEDSVKAIFGNSFGHGLREC